MSTREALYFPGTTIYSASQYPVFLLLDVLHLLQPVEAADSTDNTPDIFITSGLCQEHTPLPLGPHRERFLRLLRDIRERRDDYAAQLSSLTLASLSATQSSIDDTQQGIVASLLGRHGLAAPRESGQDELLWQARLVLKIAELLDREEEEVAMQLAMLDDQQEELMKVLQGDLDDDIEESLLAELQQLRRRLPKPTGSAVSNRLKAWTRLYLAGTPAQYPFWLTHQPEAADILLENYEKTAGAPPALLGQLTLPATIGWARQEAMARISSFREVNQPLLDEIAAALGAGDSAAIAAIAASWSAAMETAFPAEEFGRTTLLLSRLDETGLGAMLGGTKGDGRLLGVIVQAEEQP